MSKHSKEPIQRTIIIDGKQLLHSVKQLEGSELNTQEIMEAIKGLENLKKPPKTIQEAIEDLRFFHLRSVDGYYEADVTNFPTREQAPTKRLHYEVNTAPDYLLQDGRFAQTMQISGLISCIAIFIEAGDRDGTRLIGMHYTTGYHTNPDDRSISPQGKNALQSMALMCTNLEIRAVHLCHRVQINDSVHEYAATNLVNLRAHFGDGKCKVHSIGKKSDVTARLGTDGKVDIDI